jgi:putative ABC transport system permease protein
VDVIEAENLSTGTTQNVQLRAEDPNSPFSKPMLSLVLGRYPNAPGQVALTSGAASMSGVKTGDTVRIAGRSWSVTGIVEDPADLADEFALARPGQVTILFDATRGRVAGLPSAASVSYPDSGTATVNPAVIALAASVLGLAVIAVVAWARGSLGATFAHVPWIDVLVIVAGLPVVAVAGGWLLAGRQPPAISRQPLE